MSQLLDGAVPRFASVAVGVAQPESPKVNALAHVRRTDARSAQIGTPNGILNSFQIKPYSIEPSTPIDACNLLAKDNCRAALADEAKELGPKVPFVGSALTFSCIAKRLAGAGAGPDRGIVTKSGQSQCKRPSANAREKVRWTVSTHFPPFHVSDVSRIHISMRDFSSRLQPVKPSSMFWRIFIIKSGHEKPLQ
jgi:hypothetical protein